MNTFEVMEYWAKGIAEDAELCEWLSRTFDRPLTIYLGFDDVGRFGEEDAPYLVMSPTGEAGAGTGSTEPVRDAHVRRGRSR